MTIFYEINYSSSQHNYILQNIIKKKIFHYSINALHEIKFMILLIIGSNNLFENAILYTHGLINMSDTKYINNSFSLLKTVSDTKTKGVFYLYVMISCLYGRQIMLNQCSEY